MISTFKILESGHGSTLHVSPPKGDKDLPESRFTYTKSRRDSPPLIPRFGQTL